MGGVAVACLWAALALSTEAVSAMRRTSTIDGIVGASHVDSRRGLIIRRSAIPEETSSVASRLSTVSSARRFDLTTGGLLGAIGSSALLLLTALAAWRRSNRDSVAAGVLGAVAVAFSAAADPASAAPGDGAALFAEKCAACHIAGGNVLNPFKTLQLDVLNREGYSSVEAIAAAVEGGLTRMPGYGETCAPKGNCTFGPRLTPADVTAVAEYVLEQAQTGWRG
jgi:cytochrome c6